jgi:phosphate transport system permease protein
MVTTLHAVETVPEDDAPPRIRRPRRVRAFTAEDRFAVIGSVLASFALVYVGYGHILYFSGTLGFLVCWYLAFMVLYGVVVSVANPRQIVAERLVTSTLYLASGVVVGALGSVVVYVFVKGWHAIVHVNFFTKTMAGVSPTASLTHGGILHAIVGSGIEIGIAVCISVPLGIGTAVYMTELHGRGVRLVRTVVESMTGLPEILAGLFVYVVLIIDLGMQKSGFAAAAGMSVTMVPIVARAGEVALRVVPSGLREASNALGATHWKTVTRVVLPSAAAGLATATILAIARGVGETAVVLICSGASSFMNVNPFSEPMNSLPLFIYSMYITHEPTAVTRAFGAAAVLLTLVLVLFVSARLLVRGKGVQR